MGARLFVLPKMRKLSTKLATANRGMGLRYTALLLLTVFWTSMIVPTAAAIGAEYQQVQAAETQQQTTKDQNTVGGDKDHRPTDTHVKPLDQKTDTKPDEFSYTKGLGTVESKNKPATDYRQTKKSGLPGPLGNAQVPATSMGQGLQQVTSPTKQTFKEEEVTDKRTANSTTFRNKDGSYTTKRYYAPKFFKKDGKWQNIDTTLVEDKNAGDSGNIFGKALGHAESWFTGTDTYAIKDNAWVARFAPSDAE